MVSQIVQTKLVIQAVSRGFKDVDKQLESINKRLGKTEQAGRKGGKGIGALGSAFGGLGSVLATLGLGITIKQLGEFAFESTMLAARVETLGIVTQTLGANAGYTASEIDALERAIQKEGITTQASRQSLALMMQAQLDLADSTDLARLAQDAAVIAGVNSSEAFQRLINVITTGNVRMARTMGLQVNFNQGYEDLAERLGITADELTATEKAQERTNIVMAEGAQIAGAYDAAMGSVGKQVTSTPRYWEEFKVAFGKANIETVGKANTAWQGWLKTQTTAMNAITATTEAEEIGIITAEKAAEVRWRLKNNDLEYADVLTWLTQETDTYAVAVEQAILADSILLGTQQSLIGITEELGSVTQKATEAELRKLQVEAFMAGDYALVTAIGEQINALENEIFALDALIAALDLLDGKDVSYNIVAKGAGWVPDISEGKVSTGHRGGLSEYAQGGVLGNGVSTVGEQGWEFVIGNTVIPHGMSKELAQLGLKAGQGFSLGGAMDVNVPGTLEEDIARYGMYTAGSIDFQGSGISVSPTDLAEGWLDRGRPKGVETLQINNTIAALSGSVAASIAQSQLVAEKISTSTVREISRGNKEMADLMRTNNALLARLATAEEIISGISGAVGELM